MRPFDGFIPCSLNLATCLQSKGSLIKGLWLSPRNVPATLPAREPLLNKCCLLIEEFSQKAPNSPPIAAGLSLVHAFLGEKDAAIKEAERAITLLPSTKDAVDGPSFEEQLAFVEALVGDKNRAISTLQHLLEIPYSNCVTPALLRLDPKWDALRGDPHFQKLCEEKKP